MASQPQLESDPMKKLAERLARLERENELLKQQQKELSSQKSPQKCIDIDEVSDLEGTPGKVQFMIGKGLEESSYLPMSVTPV